MFDALTVTRLAAPKGTVGEVVVEGGGRRGSLRVHGGHKGGLLDVVWGARVDEDRDVGRSRAQRARRGGPP